MRAQLSGFLFLSLVLSGFALCSAESPALAQTHAQSGEVEIASQASGELPIRLSPTEQQAVFELLQESFGSREILNNFNRSERALLRKSLGRWEVGGRLGAFQVRHLGGVLQITLRLPGTPERRVRAVIRVSNAETPHPVLSEAFRTEMRPRR